MNKKRENEILDVIRQSFSLSDVVEFEEYRGLPLFDDSPETWHPLEIAISEYQMRMETDIINKLKQILIKK